MSQLKVTFETYAHQQVRVRRATLAPIRSSAHLFGSDLQLFHPSTPHPANEEIGNRCGGTGGEGASNTGRAKWLESSAGSLRTGWNSQNRYPTAALASGGSQNCCTFAKDCSSFGDVQKLKQLSHNDSDGAGTSVCVRPKMSPTFYGHCAEPLAEAVHTTFRC